MPGEVGDEIRLYLKLSDDPKAREALENLLEQLVETAGGTAGLLATLSRDDVKTVYYGLQPEEAELLSPKVKRAFRELAEKGRLPSHSLNEGGVSDEVSALTLPVKQGDRHVGLLYLQHPSGDTPFLRDSPGIYHLVADKVEVVIQNARLLRRLLRERRWLEAVIHHSSDGVVILDQKGVVIGYNQTMSSMTGWPLGEAVGRLSHEVFPLRLEAKVESSSGVVALRKVERRFSYGSTEPVEAKLQTKNGTELDVEIRGAPLFDEGGKPLGWVMNVRDVTRRKEMERLQKIFLSAVSHELHTPISVIKGFAGILSDPDIELPPEVAREKAAIIQEEAQRLERMVRQMLYATKIQAGGIKLQKEPVDLLSLVRRVTKKLEPLVQDGGGDLRLILPEELPLVQADYGKIEQVLTNLIENAIKYGGKEPIEVAVFIKGGQITVRVTDGGPGIPKEERERIFEPFERGDDPLKARVRGSGLGLYICKAIIEAHGGEIGVDEGVTGGASFYFRIPVG